MNTMSQINRQYAQDLFDEDVHSRFSPAEHEFLYCYLQFMEMYRISRGHKLISKRMLSSLISDFRGEFMERFPDRSHNAFRCRHRKGMIWTYECAVIGKFPKTVERECLLNAEHVTGMWPHAATLDCHRRWKAIAEKGIEDEVFSPWNDLSIRTPKKDDNCLVWTVDKRLLIAMWFDSKVLKEPYFSHIDLGKLNVTHWMPAPETP